MPIKTTPITYRLAKLFSGTRGVTQQAILEAAMKEFAMNHANELLASIEGIAELFGDQSEEFLTALRNRA